VEILGGRLFIVSDEHGTRVHFSIPIIRQSTEAP